MPRRRATSVSSSHRASSRRLIAASPLNGPPAVCKGRPCTLARAGVRGGQGRPAMIKTILVALDGSEHADAALQYALWLAERVRATVLGLHVIDVVSIEGSFLHDISGSLGFEPYLDFSAKMREALRVLDEARRYLHSYGLALSCETITGYPHQRIVEFIRERGHDLLFIGAYGHSRIIEMVLGSTTEFVLRNSPCPVFLAR